jgi:nicotinamide mononucleotide transporter
MRIGKDSYMSFLEIIAFLTSLIGVVFGILGPRITWPWWAISSLLYAIIFYQSEYYASAALQLIFILGGLWGWFGWGKTGAKPRYSTNTERLIILATLLIASIALYPVLIDIGATSSAIEAFGFIGSVIAQLLMVKERFEAWPLWLVVDAAYTYQYFQGKLYLTSFLYLIFSALAMWGWIRWQKEATANGLPRFIK